MTEPGIPQKAPYVMDMKPGDYFWCQCGFSKKQPFCDGSHAASGTGLGPLKVTIDQAKKVAWCGCKRSGKKPFCDGSHKKIT
jgi:CDGSH-type Zn-finger protein